MGVRLKQGCDLQVPLHGLNKDGGYVSLAYL